MRIENIKNSNVLKPGELLLVPKYCKLCYPELDSAVRRHFLIRSVSIVVSLPSLRRESSTFQRWKS